MWSIIKGVGKLALTIGGVGIGVGALYSGTLKVLADADKLNVQLQNLLATQVGEQEVLADAFAEIPAQTIAAVSPFLPLIRERLLALCDVNHLVKEIKRVTAALKQQHSLRSSSSSSSSTSSSSSSSTANYYDEHEVANLEAELCALWEEIKIVSIARLLAATCTIAALTSIVRIHLTLYTRITTAARNHYVKTLSSSAMKDNAEEEEETGAGGGGGQRGRQQQQRQFGSFTEANTNSAIAAAQEEYDRIARQRQQTSLATLVDVLFGQGLESLVQHIRKVVLVMTSTPAYAVQQMQYTTSNENSNSGLQSSARLTLTPTVIRAQHFTGLLEAILVALDPATTTTTTAASIRYYVDDVYTTGARRRRREMGVSSGGVQRSPTSSSSSSSYYETSAILSLLLPHEIRTPSPSSSSPTTTSTTTSNVSSSSFSTSNAQGEERVTHVTTAAQLIALATGQRSAMSGATTSSSSPYFPVIWTSQVLMNMTLDAMRSPTGQAAFRIALEDTVRSSLHSAVFLHAFGGSGSSGGSSSRRNINAATATSNSVIGGGEGGVGGNGEEERPFGAVLLALKNATNFILESNSVAVNTTASSGSSSGKNVLGDDSESNTFLNPAVVASCNAAPLSELCYQLMWHAKLM